MERSSITKWLLIGVAVLLFWQFGRPLLMGSKTAPVQPITAFDGEAPPAAARAPEELCVIEGEGFRAELSTKGGSLRHFVLADQHFAKHGQPMDVVSTSQEWSSPLRTNLRMPGGAAPQVPFDDLDWKLTVREGRRCTFTYTDATTSITKTIAATTQPYQLEVTLNVENLAAEPRKHRLAVQQTAYVKAKETEGSLGGQSEWLTETVAAAEKKTERQHPSDFEPDDFKDKEFTGEAWRRTAGEGRFVAVSNSYFTRMAIPIKGPGAPAVETRIEDDWDRSRFAPADKAKDPNHAHVYRARLAYPEVELKPKETAAYQLLAFFGPKDRHLLAALPVDTTDVLDLGTFAVIAKALMWYLSRLFQIVRSWGFAIVLLTITVRTALFPLSIAQIKSSLAMRQLKPEMDIINEKYKDDATQKGLAIQELWRKNKVANPVLGCLPMLLQMPVWFALYTALQRSIELYHTPFGPVIPDLSSPGLYYIIPLVLGASSFVQQKLMPPQGDLQQQKMMLYMMPAVFTVMMLFLPAGLGVYMMTNTWLGIGQQLLVERYLKAKQASGGGGSPGEIVVREKTEGEGFQPTPTLGKGKARVRG